MPASTPASNRYPIVTTGLMAPADTMTLVDPDTGLPTPTPEDALDAAFQPLHAVMIREHRSRAPLKS